MSPSPKSPLPTIRSWIAFAVVVLAVAGCSKLKNEEPSNKNSGGGGVANSNSGPPTSAPPAAAAAGTPTSWEANASSLEGKEGKTFNLACSPNGTTHSVWGSDIYTTDSSICTAAVHSGLITVQNGGTVTLEIRPGRDFYGCSERNGVTSACYGRWGASFVLLSPKTETAIREAETETTILWTYSAAMLDSGKAFSWKFKCPADGKEGNVWGTDTYTADSSICNAAVHSGKFSREAGGSVTVELRPGEESYAGSTRNGVTTISYGPYDRSFVIK